MHGTNHSYVNHCSPHTTYRKRTPNCKNVSGAKSHINREEKPCNKIQFNNLKLNQKSNKKC